MNHSQGCAIPLRQVVIVSRHGAGPALLRDNRARTVLPSSIFCLGSFRREPSNLHDHPTSFPTCPPSVKRAEADWTSATARGVAAVVICAAARPLHYPHWRPVLMDGGGVVRPAPQAKKASRFSLLVASSWLTFSTSSNPQAQLSEQEVRTRGPFHVGLRGRRRRCS